MNSRITTPFGKLNFQGNKVQTVVNRYQSRGDLSADMKAKGSRTEVNSYWGDQAYISGNVQVHDQDSKPNLKLEFHRRNGAGTLNVKNPGRKGDGTSVSIPIGDVDKTSDNFFSKGFFPANGISEVRVSVEKDEGQQYTALEFRQGEGTISHVYRVEQGVIYEVPHDAGFSGYYDYHGHRA